MDLNQELLRSIESCNEDEIHIRVKTKFMRKLPDPINPNIKHFIGFMKAEDYVEKFPDNPNPRPSDETDLNRNVYKEVVNSFLNIDCTPNTFHLKSHSCRITCSNVIKVNEDEYILIFKGREGIADGLHCLNVVYEYKDQSPQQYISFWITIGIEDSFITEMSQGLNSNMQVSLESLLNYDGKFDWIKNVLSNQAYSNDISYIETIKKNISVTFIIQLLTLFNIERYPIYGADSPTCAYSQKSSCLKYYNENIEQYKKLSKVLPDILALYDTIQITAPELYGKGSSNLSFVESKKKPFDFYFIQKSRSKRLTSGAVFPLLAAFRTLLEIDQNNGYYKWKVDNGLEGLVEIWNLVGQRLLKSTKSNFDDLGRDPNKLGKSSSHWKSIFMEFQLVVAKEINFE